MSYSTGTKVFFNSCVCIDNGIAQSEFGIINSLDVNTTISKKTCIYRKKVFMLGGGGF